MRHTQASLLFVLGLQVLRPREAEASSVVAYKYQDYAESGGRVGVQVHAVDLEVALSGAQSLRLHGVVDTIAGATPTGQPAPQPGGQVPLSQMHDRRTAWDATWQGRARDTQWALRGARSAESDYIAHSGGLTLTQNFRLDNTQLIAGFGAGRDRVKVFHREPWERKHTRDFMLGATHLASRTTSVALTLTHGSVRGYQSDPYKIIQKTVEILPGLELERTFSENRPRERDKWSFAGTLREAFPRVDGSLELGGRLYRDDWSVHAHTVSATWFQEVGTRLVLAPTVRLHTQSEASFYRARWDGTDLLPEEVPGGPVFYSSDYRLSKLRSWTYGLKAVLTLPHDIVLDVAYERYDMQGRDGLTDASAYPTANIVTLGASYSW